MVRLLSRHRDSVIASGSEERNERKKEKEMDERAMWFSVRHCGIKSHIKSSGVIA